MNLDDINQSLANLLNSGDPAFANAAQFVQQVIQEVLQDVQRQMEVIQAMEQMAFKETLNTVINGVITLISVA